MRDIQFRGKCAVTGEWCYGYLAHFPDSVCGWALTKENYLDFDHHRIYSFDYAEVLNDTIGQYTGLTDYFNTPVYEGDIIENENMYGVVRYGSHAPSTSTNDATAVGFYIEWIGEKAGILRNDLGFWLNRRDSVIRGNIYDTPELMGVKL